MNGFAKIVVIKNATAKQRRMLSAAHGGSKLAPSTWFLGDHRPALEIGEELKVAGKPGQSIHVYEILSSPQHGAVVNS